MTESGTTTQTGETDPSPLAMHKLQPERVDLGAPERSRTQFPWVYANLMPNALAVSRLSGKPGAPITMQDVLIFALVTGATCGFWAVAALLLSWSLRRARKPLFEHGHYAKGTIRTVEIKPGKPRARIQYDFAIDKSPIEGWMTLNIDLARRLHKGEPVSVLFAPDEPDNNVLTYR